MRPRSRPRSPTCCSAAYKDLRRWALGRRSLSKENIFFAWVAAEPPTHAKIKMIAQRVSLQQELFPEVALIYGPTMASKRQSIPILAVAVARLGLERKLERFSRGWDAKVIHKLRRIERPENV